MSDYNEHLISMAGGDGDVLGEIEARAQAATEGPWEHEPYRGQNQNGDYAGGHIFDGDGEYLISEVSDRDGAFIAHARKDVPTLLTLVREQQARLDRVLELANWAGKRGWTLDAAAIRKALEPTK
jgi:hypothetical protein